MHGARAGGARDARFGPPPPGADAPARGTPAVPPATVALLGLGRGRPTAPPPPPSFYGPPPAFAYGAAVPMPGPARVPELTYMESQMTTQAVLVNQQHRIKQLEAELFKTQAEVTRLQNAARERERERPADGAAQDGEGKKPSSRYWTPDEHKRFLEGLELYGPREIKSISRHVGTRSATQVRTHAQKYYLRIERERAKENAAAGGAASTATPGKPGSSTGSPAAAGRGAGQNQQTQQRQIAGPIQGALPRLAAPGGGSQATPASVPHGSTATPVAPANAGSKASASPQSPRRTSARRSPPSPRSGKRRARPRARAQSGELLRLAADLPNGRAAGSGAGNAGAGSSAAAAGGAPSGGPPEGEEPRKRAHHASPTRGSPARRVKPRPMSEPARAGASVTRVASSSALAHLPRVPAGLGPWGSGSGDAKAEPALAPNDGAPSRQKPPSLRRNESSNSVLADLAKGAASAAPLSRSNSFLSRDGVGGGVGGVGGVGSVGGSGRGFHRTNSILSLLSGFPTAGLHQSSSTERLLGLDGADDKLLATLKATDGASAAASAAAGAAGGAAGPSSAAARESLGDRSLSFGQLDNMAALADFDDPSSVAIALQEDKWNGES